LVALTLTGLFCATALAYNAPGCYQNGNLVDCFTPSGADDFGGNPMNPGTDCYISEIAPVASKNDSNWKAVSCIDLTSPPGPICVVNGQSYFCPSDATINVGGNEVALTSQPPNVCYSSVGGDVTAPASGTTLTSNSSPDEWTEVPCGSAVTSKYYCGGPPDTKIYTSIDLGCVGKGNPILDMIFGIVRFLSDGVGLVVIASLIIAGIQFSASGGDPGAAEKAIKRIRTSVSALLLFIFAYAILNYVLPGAVLR
jgi:hypothetical protein